MNTYTDKLQQSTVAILGNLSAQHATLVSEQTAAQYVLYYAQGAQQVTREKLKRTRSQTRHAQQILQQAVINQNQAGNLSASSTGVKKTVNVSASNVATAAANVQVASQLIEQLAGDLGAALNVASASMHQTGLYAKLSQANCFVNEVANHGRKLSLAAMEASSYAAEIIADEVVNQVGNAQNKIGLLQKAVQTEFTRLSSQIGAETAAVAQASQQEQQAEGRLQDAEREVAALEHVYQQANQAMNLDLSVSVLNQQQILLSFSPMPMPLPGFTTPLAQEVQAEVPAADPAYRLVLVPQKQRSLFSPELANQIFIQENASADLFYPVQFEAKAERVQLVCTPEQDVFKNPIVPGESYVVYLYLELASAYKRHVGNFADWLSASSQSFVLATALPSAHATPEIAAFDMSGQFVYQNQLAELAESSGGDIEKMAAISGKALAAMDGKQIAALLPEQICLLTAVQIASLKPLQLQALTMPQIGCLSGKQIAALSREQMAALSPGQMAALTEAQKQDMASESDGQDSALAQSVLQTNNAYQAALRELERARSNAETSAQQEKAARLLESRWTEKLHAAQTAKRQGSQIQTNLNLKLSGYVSQRNAQQVSVASATAALAEAMDALNKNQTGLDQAVSQEQQMAVEIAREALEMASEADAFLNSEIAQTQGMLAAVAQSIVDADAQLSNLNEQVAESSATANSASAIALADAQALARQQQAVRDAYDAWHQALLAKQEADKENDARNRMIRFYANLKPVGDMAIEFRAILVEIKDEEGNEPAPGHLMHSHETEDPIPPIYFNRDIALQVSPGCYSVASADHGQRANNGRDHDVVCYSVAIDDTSSDNFGKPLHPNKQYQPFILAVVNDAEALETGNFTPTLSTRLPLWSFSAK